MADTPTVDEKPKTLGERIGGWLSTPRDLSDKLEKRLKGEGFQLWGKRKSPIDIEAAKKAGKDIKEAVADPAAAASAAADAAIANAKGAADQTIKAANGLLDRVAGTAAALTLTRPKEIIGGGAGPLPEVSNRLIRKLDTPARLGDAVRVEQTPLPAGGMGGGTNSAARDHFKVAAAPILGEVDPALGTHLHTGDLKTSPKAGAAAKANPMAQINQAHKETGGLDALTKGELTGSFDQSVYERARAQLVRAGLADPLPEQPGPAVQTPPPVSRNLAGAPAPMGPAGMA